MAKNKVYIDGDQFTIEVPEGTESGDPVVIGDLPGVALIDEEDGEATVDFRGVYELEVSSSTEVGDILYFSDGDLSTDSEGTRFGYAVESGSEGNAIRVKVGY